MGILSLAFSTLMVASKGAYDSLRTEPMPFVAEEPDVCETLPLCATQRQRLLAAVATGFAGLEDVDVYAFSMANLNEEGDDGQTLRMLESGALELSCAKTRARPVVFERLDDTHFYAQGKYGSGIVLRCIDALA